MASPASPALNYNTRLVAPLNHANNPITRLRCLLFNHIGVANFQNLPTFNPHRANEALFYRARVTAADLSVARVGLTQAMVPGLQEIKLSICRKKKCMDPDANVVGGYFYFDDVQPRFLYTIRAIAVAYDQAGDVLHLSSGEKIQVGIETDYASPNMSLYSQIHYNWERLPWEFVRQLLQIHSKVLYNGNGDPRDQAGRGDLRSQLRPIISRAAYHHFGPSFRQGQSKIGDVAMSDNTWAMDI